MLTSSPSPTTHAVARAGPSTRSFRRNSRSTPSTAANTSSPRSSSRHSLTTVSQTNLPFPPKSPSAPAITTESPQFTTSYSTHTTQTSPGWASADAGTQYSPPDWPPTSTRSSLYRSSSPPATAEFSTTSPTADGSVQQSHGAAPEPVPESALPRSQPSPKGRSEPEIDPQEPPEPRLRVTPQSSLQNANARRSHSALSDGSGEAGSHSARSSSPKRARELSAGHKVLPADYAECRSQELATLIADMLMELIRFNDEIPLRDGHLTRFHSRAPPGISVHDYVQRLTLHATLSPPILLAMVFYIDRLCQCFPNFTINSLTVHRFLITAATVASKGLSDSFWTNSTYARVGGVSVRELAILELELLTRVYWRIVPEPETLAEYYRSLVARRSDEYSIEGSENETNTDGGDANSSLESRNDAVPVGTGMSVANDLAR